MCGLATDLLLGRPLTCFYHQPESNTRTPTQTFNPKSWGVKTGSPWAPISIFCQQRTPPFPLPLKHTTPPCRPPRRRNHSPNPRPSARPPPPAPRRRRHRCRCRRRRPASPLPSAPAHPPQNAPSGPWAEGAMVANEMRSARSYLVARELKRCKRIHGVYGGGTGVCGGAKGAKGAKGARGAKGCQRG